MSIASQHPDKVKQLDALFWSEGNKFQGLPLDASVSARVAAPRPSLSAGKTDFAWSGTITGTPNGDAPSVLDASFTYRAGIVIRRPARMVCW